MLTSFLMYATKTFRMLLHHSVKDRMDSCFLVCYAKFKPNHSNLTTEIKNRQIVSKLLFFPILWLLENGILIFCFPYLNDTMYCKWSGVLSVQRRSSVYIPWKEKLSQVSLLCYQFESVWPFTFGLYNQQGSLTGIFFTIPCKY